jgi:hypothetical protein
MWAPCLEGPGTPMDTMDVDGPPRAGLDATLSSSTACSPAESQAGSAWRSEAALEVRLCDFFCGHCPVHLTADLARRKLTIRPPDQGEVGASGSTALKVWPVESRVKHARITAIVPRPGQWWRKFYR